ncbi:hypothetical protein [Stigmatella aurantiaca]|uniref:Conserved uncharacterized protein n=1 Tax=Stigmatella aurantiaca (strain DW4/3-1) TaxID=378806 RepID=Q08R70_STIAD|nr:hypothetical protein [Stigmatella aurantiaca]ADO74541.1 conserved uncharacterized protein [Stigmatella aurantiaca DW4/3-1]EAU62982.1 hypothetical protein STIAU_8184 [Stigmatella aurantiaca DW4/3-1]
MLLPGAASAQRQVTAPVDIAVGPTALLFFGPVFEDQPLHTGLKINVEAVLDQEWLRKNQSLIPRKYRSRALKAGEIRYSPPATALIPETLIISPKYQNTGIYGATWKPLGFGLSFTPSPVRLSFDAGLVLTYAYLYSDTLENTHFLRPGLQAGLDLEFQLSKSFLVSLGWASAFYIPQKLGTLGEVKPLDASIFHVGQPYLLLHFRVPVTTRL